MGETVLITSGKGGAGKSTFAVNCGAALARMGRRVLIVDADAGLRAIDLMLSVQDSVIYDLSDVLAGRCEPVKAILSTGVEGLFVLPAPLDPADGSFEPEGMRRLCRGLTNYYEFVLIDSAAGMGPEVMTAAAGAGRAVIIATPDPVGVRDAGRIAVALEAAGLTKLRLVLNRVRPRLIRHRAAAALDRAIDDTAVQLLGVIPEDEAVVLATFEGHPVLLEEKSRKNAAGAFGNIARRLVGEEVPLMKL